MKDKKHSAWLGQIKAVGWDLDGTLYSANLRMWSEILGLIHGTVAAKFSWSLEKTKTEYSQVYERLGSNTKTMNEFGFYGEAFFRQVWVGAGAGYFCRR